ncbi:sarcosine oxidase subunit gamma [Actinoplanes derwentensis]|uniref:Sarcosine oxidase subunit gamma n=1 Tax=Actinoplanes derwentensis TaxID=113562 RepID=A0A1H2AKM5_9ACTN|nr:sarcosine oxidase subunit gamma family protein [Actinoplanes derwentensis]GID88797.1 sarcosine oxidase subunit gamma [Actinoplanes derwentensis]SDT46511.1 sarcosine oxidase subunit gamma [Actinoplanes derwentensis]
MADQTPRSSPLAGFALPSADAGVTLAEVPFLTQLSLRADQAGGLPLPTAAGTSTVDGEATFVWLGPDEWLVIGPPGAQRRLTERLETVSGCSVVDVSAQRTTLELSGPGARELLALGCSLDLHPRVFEVGRCAQTTLAHAPVILLRREPSVIDTDPVFWVLVRASFAAHLASWVLDARGDLTGGY